MDLVPIKSASENYKNWQRLWDQMLAAYQLQHPAGDVHAKIVGNDLPDIIHWNKYGSDPNSKVNWDNYAKNKALDPSDRDYLQRYKMERDLLKQVRGTKENDGSVTVSDGHGPFARIGNDGALTPTLRQPPDSTDNINTLLKSSVLYRAINGDSIQLGKDNELETLMTAKAASLAGLTVTNPPERTLDQVNPKLAHQMEQDWEKLDASYHLKKTDGLVTTPIALDKIEPRALSTGFSLSANGLSPEQLSPKPVEVAPIVAPRTPTRSA